MTLTDTARLFAGLSREERVRALQVLNVVRSLEALEDEDRLSVFGLFCTECGCTQPEGRGCQCWNDE